MMTNNSTEQHGGSFDLTDGASSSRLAFHKHLYTKLYPGDMPSLPDLGLPKRSWVDSGTIESNPTQVPERAEPTLVTP